MSPNVPPELSVRTGEDPLEAQCPPVRVNVHPVEGQGDIQGDIESRRGENVPQGVFASPHRRGGGSGGGTVTVGWAQALQPCGMAPRRITSPTEGKPGQVGART